MTRCMVEHESTPTTCPACGYVDGAQKVEALQKFIDNQCPQCYTYEQKARKNHA